MLRHRILISCLPKFLQNFAHDVPAISHTGRMCFSAEAAATRKTHPAFRTLETNPVNHTMIQEAKYYEMSKEMYSKLFPFSGVVKKYMEQINTFGEACFMVRQPALELIGYLEKTNFSNPAVRYVIYGDTGVGKSLTLSHLVHYAFVKQWFIIHVPWGPIWTTTPKEKAPSLYNPIRYDLPLDSAVWLQQFRSQNLHLLEQYDLRVSKRYEWSKREATEEGELLLSVIEHGVNRMNHASDCVAVVMKEIKQQSQIKGFKVFVAIDGVNTFFLPSLIRRPDKTYVLPEDITVVRAIKKLLNNDWINASVVVTVGTSSSPVEIRNAFTPYHLLKKEGFELLEPFVPILVKNYTPKEIDSCLDYYIDNMWLQSEKGRTELGRNELKFLSGYNPAALMKLCNVW